MAIIPGTGLIISLEYDPTGLAWARLYDNLVLGWYVSDTIPDAPVAQAGPPPVIEPGIAPHPIILGHLLAKVVTDPVISPQWVKYTEPDHPGAAQGSVFVQDLWRGSIPDFFLWLATNNGAQRKLSSNLTISKHLIDGFADWVHDYNYLWLDA